MIEIMPVDWADIIKAELLEQSAARPEAARKLLGAGGTPFPILRQKPLGKLLQEAAEAPVGPAGDQLGKIGAHRADRRRDRHVVIVEDDAWARIDGAAIVHAYIAQARANRAVAISRKDVVLLAGGVARARHPEARRDRGRGMAGTEGVVLALGPFAEAGEPASLTQRADAVAPAGQDLVGIGLVADVPDQLVVRRIEHVVERDG